MGDAFECQAPVLEADGLTLRALSVEDAPAVFAYASDPEVARYTLWPPHVSEDATREFLRMLTAPWILGWAIVPRVESSAAGMVFLHSLSRQHRKAELAFNIARSHWNRGLATAASRLVLRHSFAELGLNRVEATCMPANAASARVLGKLGMSREGGMRRSHMRHDGFHDMDLFAVLRDEFRA
jgi:ribosomal-protein-alanine N-acetyltransferase